MITSFYKILPVRDYPANYQREALDAIDEANTYIISLAANLMVALDLLSQAGVNHRLNESVIDEGIRVIVGLADVRSYIEDGREEQ
jgi:hypothetical protein